MFPRSNGAVPIMDGQTSEFLHALWPEIPRGGAVQMWRLQDRKTFSFTNVEAAAEWARGYVTEDIYLAAGLGPALARPAKTRTHAGRVLGIPGVWADIDINGGPEDKTGAAPDRQAALTVAHAHLEPTYIVNSGYGIQAWWLFEEPWLFYGDTAEMEREQAACIVRGYQAALRATAKDMEFDLDSTHDLARLMRLPGTVNCKGSAKALTPAPVEIIVGDGPRYVAAAFEDITREHLGALNVAMARADGSGVDIELRGNNAAPPIMRIEELKQIKPEFAQAWEYGKLGRTGRGIAKSPSEWDLSIANHLAQAGFSEQEICDSLTYNRIRHGDTKQKYLREKYMKSTIGKAMVRGFIDSERERQEVERSEAIEALAGAATVGMSNPVSTMSQFSKVIGGPEVKRLIQDGIDPTNAQYRLELDDGRDVPLGGVEGLLDMRRFRAAFAVVTQHIVPNIKGDKWTQAVQALVHAAEVHEEDSRVAITHGWLDSYLDGALSSDKDSACVVNDPFEHDGEVFISASTFADWLRRIKSVRMKDSEVCQYLHAAGFDRRGVNYTRDDGRKTQRSYWVAPKESLTFL